MQLNVCCLQPPECHAISRAAGDVLYTPEQVPVLRASASLAAFDAAVDNHILKLLGGVHAQVAKCIARGMEQRAYHLPGPDLGQNLMVAASAGLSPHMYNGLLEFLLAPIIVIVLRVFGGILDTAVRKHAAATQRQR